MAQTVNAKTPISAKVVLILLSVLASFILGQVLPDRIHMQDADATLRAEVAQLKSDAQRYVRREEFEQFSKGLEQRLLAIERSLEKIDRKLDR